MSVRNDCLQDIHKIKEFLESRKLLVGLSEHQIWQARSQACNIPILEHDVCTNKKPVIMNYDDMSNAARYVQAVDMLQQYKEMINSAKEDDVVKLICSANKMDLVKELIKLILPNEVHQSRALLKVLKDDLVKLKDHVPKKRIEEYQILLNKHSNALLMEKTVIDNPLQGDTFIKIVKVLINDYEQMMGSLPRLTKWRYQIFGWGEESLSFSLIILVILIIMLFMFSVKDYFLSNIQWQNEHC